MSGPAGPIAVVGMDCRFPGAPDKDALWNMLMRGEHGIVEVPTERWDAEAFYSLGGQAGTANTRSAGLIQDPDAFDHEFFGISPREAATMDPQQRLLLQSSWRAAEDAGIDPTSLGGSATGVYVGVMSSEWALLHMTDYQELTAHHGTGNGYHMAANRISYHLDLRGPSVAVDTACSSSLVAVDLATTALRSGDCDLAIVGGVNLILTPALSIFYTQAGLSAPDGQCKPFSAQANGIGRGEGVGVVVLRRLEDALADRQLVYAVIDASAVSHDGRSNGITAPNRWSQIQVINTAYREAGITPGDICFVEAHGTGTVLGDMIEAKALGAVHGVERERPCALGSVKGNIGHAEGAAGIAGLIKACLALDRGVLPPSLHSNDENPELRLAENGLRLARTPLRLPKDTARAAVSSFGLGGTNAHVVLSTPPAARRSIEPGGVGVLTVSANTGQALRRNLAVIGDLVESRPPERLAQICHSTNLVKSSLPHRFALAVSSREELLTGIRDVDSVSTDTRAGRPARVVFLCTGQGAEYPGMTMPLYRNCPPYRERLDEVDEAMRPHLGHSVASMVLDREYHGGFGIHDPARAQPALFAVEYALGSALRDLGVWPEAMVGHDIGEYAAACLAEVLTLPEACRIVVARGTLAQELPDDGSPLMRPIMDSFSQAIAELPTRPPAVPIASSLHGRFVTSDELDSYYWTEQFSAPVRFEAALRAARELAPTHLIEIGPAPVLLGLARQAGLEDEATGLVPCPGEDATGQEIAEVLATLYRGGLKPRWDALYTNSQRVPWRLPAYVFADGTRFWTNPVATPSPGSPAPDAGSNGTPDAGSNGTEDPISRRTLETLAELGDYPVGGLRTDARLREDLGYDSITLMRLSDRLTALLRTDEPLPVTELLSRLTTVGDVLSYVSDHSTAPQE
jgi:acyl transferase domain-containing protein